MNPFPVARLPQVREPGRQRRQHERVAVSTDQTNMPNVRRPAVVPRVKGFVTYLSGTISECFIDFPYDAVGTGGLSRSNTRICFELDTDAAVDAHGKYLQLPVAKSCAVGAAMQLAKLARSGTLRTPPSTVS